MKYNAELIRKVMILSHELGVEIDREEAVSRIEELCVYIREHENPDADIDYALSYMIGVLKRKYYGRR